MLVPKLMVLGLMRLIGFELKVGQNLDLYLGQSWS
jgi:hypothetical protein